MKDPKKWKKLIILTIISSCGLALCGSFLITYLIMRGIVNNSWTWNGCTPCKSNVKINNDIETKLLNYYEDGK